MNIAPIDFADFNLVEVKTTPHCQKHGAMNKTTADGYSACNFRAKPLLLAFVNRFKTSNTSYLIAD